MESGEHSAREPVRTQLPGLRRTALLAIDGYPWRFNSTSSVAHAAYAALGASWRPWSQNRNYLGNGFVGGSSSTPRSGP